MALAMPAAGFYPKGGGRLEAWIEPASPRPLGPARARPAPSDPGDRRGRQPPRRHRRADARPRHPAPRGVGLDAGSRSSWPEWPSPGQGAALSLIAEHDGTHPRHVRRPGRARQAVGGRRRRGRRPAPRLRGRRRRPPSIPTPPTRSSCPWPSRRAAAQFTVSEVTEHLRTNVETIAAFLDRPITIEEPEGEGRPGRRDRVSRASRRVGETHRRPLGPISRDRSVSPTL